VITQKEIAHTIAGTNVKREIRKSTTMEHRPRRFQLNWLFP